MYIYIYAIGKSVDSSLVKSFGSILQGTADAKRLCRLHEAQLTNSVDVYYVFFLGYLFRLHGLFWRLNQKAAGLMKERSSFEIFACVTVKI